MTLASLRRVMELVELQEEAVRERGAELLEVVRTWLRAAFPHLAEERDQVILAIALLHMAEEALRRVLDDERSL